MKKKIFSIVFALALLATAGWGVNKSMSNDAGLSDLALSNVEALAQNEDDYPEFWENCAGSWDPIKCVCVEVELLLTPRRLKVHVLLSQCNTN